MITLKACPICKSGLIEKYHLMGILPSVMHEIMPGIIRKAGIFSLYSICQNCRVIFQNPRFSDAELDVYYREGYYRGLINDTQKKMDDSEKSWAQFYKNIIVRSMGKVTSHLDVGCSRGYLLGAVRARIRVGVEPNTGYVRATGVKVYADLSQVPRDTFALVTLFHVLEHVSAPLDYLKQAVSYVGDNGYLFIEVPTWKSPGGPLRLSHLYHFEPEVMQYLCKEAGLQIESTEFTPHLLLKCRRLNTV